DGVEIAEITDPAILEYTDGDGLDSGSYQYYVTAIYTDGESAPSNTVDVEITLPAPANFTATLNATNHSVLCQWTSMTGVSSYNLYRDNEVIATPSSAFYLNTNVPGGSHVYYVAAVFNGGFEGEGSSEVTVVVPVGNDQNLIPAVTSLEGNYPNPFNPTTTIRFGLTTDENVNLVIYNTKGEKVKTLVNNELEAGYHNFVWNGLDDNGKQSASGVYFYKMQTEKYQSTKKMILMK
nr:FlgD immunoglobulin-like domain containing protein [Candidatus Cloacimonadota bacterium]